MPRQEKVLPTSKGTAHRVVRPRSRTNPPEPTARPAAGLPRKPAFGLDPNTSSFTGQGVLLAFRVGSDGGAFEARRRCVIRQRSAPALRATCSLEMRSPMFHP